MSLFLAIALASLLPSAFVKEIPDSVRAAPIISISAAKSRLIANHGNRIFFRLKGTIVTASPESTDGFVLLDQTGGTSVLCSCNDAWQPGDEIEVICTAMQPTYNNPRLLSEALEIKVLRHTSPVEPLRIQLSELAGHRCDFRPIQTTGIVVDVFPDDFNSKWTVISIVSDDVRTMVWVPTKSTGQESHSDLIDAEVLVTGTVFPDPINFYRARGPWILTSSASDIQVTRPAPFDPFQAPAEAPHRQVITGQVVASWLYGSFFLSTSDNRRIFVKLIRGQELPHPGDQVTVAGFLYHNEIGARLLNAISRLDSRSSDNLEKPICIDAESILLNPAGEYQINAALNGHTIQTSGIVREHYSAETPNASFELSTKNAALRVLTGTTVKLPPVGALVEVCGACIIEADIDQDTEIMRAKRVDLALRTPGELHILKNPPWWTPGRLFVLIGVLIIILFGIIIWNAILQKIIVRRSRELAKESIRSAGAALRLEERTRLAVELHDTIAQNLTGASFEIKAATRLASSAPEKMGEHLEIVNRMLKSCRDNIRNCIWDLRANTLNLRDLNEAIHLALSPHIGNATLQVRFNVPRSRLSEPTLYALMRIVRELAINGVRHGKATKIKVAGSIENQQLIFSVRDNGSGFDPNKAPGALDGHFGLQGIRERVKKLNGTMEIDSSPSLGTRTVVRLNLTSPTDDIKL